MDLNKFGSMSLNKSPSSSLARSYARQSLAGPSPGQTNGSTSLYGTTDSLLPPDLNASAASTLAQQRAKLKASARTSAPANLLLGASGGGLSLGDSIKSPLWAREETLQEQRSPSPLPHSSAAADSSSSSSQYLRSPIPDLGSSFADQQMSPLVGGNWASMVNTPLVPMFATQKAGGDSSSAHDFGTSVGPGAGSNASNLNLDGVGQRLAAWNGGASTGSNGSIVLDDARKFRRSARVPGAADGAGGLNGGALSGMYDENTTTTPGGGSVNDQRANSAAMAQRRVQEQIQAMQQFKGTGPAGSSSSAGGGGGGGGGSRMTSTGALGSPGLQQTAMAAQQNWRNANAAHLPPPSPQQDVHQSQHYQQQQQHFAGVGGGYGQQQQQQYGGGLGSASSPASDSASGWEVARRRRLLSLPPSRLSSQVSSRCSNKSCSSNSSCRLSRRCKASADSAA